MTALPASLYSITSEDRLSPPVTLLTAATGVVGLVVVKYNRKR